MLPLVVILFQLFSVPFTRGFNLDAENALVRDGPTGSYFGFSVALLNNTEGTWLLAGAPLVKQDDRSSGGIYKCPVIQSSSGTDCLEIPLSQTGGGPPGVMQIGTTLDMQPNVRDKIVYCGSQVDPRSGHESNATVYGMCYELLQDLDYRRSSRISPMSLGRGLIGDKDGQFLDADNHEKIFYFPVHNSEGNTMIVGNPASQNGKGVVVLYRGNRRLKRKVFPDLERDSFAGYALSSGRLFRDPRLYYVVGAPGAAGSGKLFILGDNFDIIKEATGDQAGGYFGAAVAVVDLNGDGLDDIVVGAPLYTTTSKEEGAVLVYINKDNKILEEVSQTLTGSKSLGGKFGAAIENVGDLNRDSKEDIAVGAPYEDDGRGAIYIYNGDSTGVAFNGMYTQRIAAKDLTGNLMGFGSVFSRVDDLDGNAYGDLAVGAPESDSAVVFLSRPVVDLQPRFRFHPSVIDPRNMNCRHQEKRATCVRIEACFVFRGYNLPEYLDVAFSLKADVLKKEARVKIITGDDLLEQGNSTLRISRRRTACTKHTALVLPNVEDIFTPILFNLTFDLVKPDQKDSVSPILSTFVKTFNSTEVFFQRDCGEDNQCQSDLVVNTRLIYPENRAYLILGADDALRLQVNILNSAEAAYLSEVIVTYSDNVEFLQDPRSPVRCEIYQGDFMAPMNNPQSKKAQKKTKQVICDVGNPIKTNKEMTFALVFDTRQLSTMSAPIEFTTYARTASTDTNMGNNVRGNKAEVRLQASTQLAGSSIPEDLTVYRGAPDSDQGSRKIIHAYELLNKGPAMLKKATVLLVIPSGNLTAEQVSLDRVEVEGSETGRAKCRRLSTSQNMTMDEPASEMAELKSDPCADSSCYAVRCSVKGLEHGQTIMFRVELMLVAGAENNAEVTELTVQTSADISFPDDTIFMDSAEDSRKKTISTKVNIEEYVAPEVEPTEEPEPDVNAEPTPEAESKPEPSPESESEAESEGQPDSGESVGEAEGGGDDAPSSATTVSPFIPLLGILTVLMKACL